MTVSAGTKGISVAHIFNGAIWTAQSVLAAVLAGWGLSLVTQPHAQSLAEKPWLAAATMPGALTALALIELALAFGLVAPSITRIYPLASPATAGVTAVVLVALSAFQASSGHLTPVALNLALIALAAFVAWGRWRKCPIEGHAYLR